MYLEDAVLSQGVPRWDSLGLPPVVPGQGLRDGGHGAEVAAHLMAWNQEEKDSRKQG